MHLDPENLRTLDIYTWMVSLITPRPIAWVSTLSDDGVANLAPYSFFNAVGSKPPLLMFCPANRVDGTPKDSLANVQRNGEFVVNLVTERFLDAMNQTAAEVGPDVDEFVLCDLAKAASQKVRPPRVAGAAAAFECVLHQIIQLGVGAGGANLVLGRIVAMHVDDALLDEQGQLVTERVDTVGRLGGPRYSLTRERVELPRPTITKSSLESR